MKAQKRACGAKRCAQAVDDDRYLCRSCLHMLLLDLGSVPSLVDDLETMYTRRDVFHDRTGRASAGANSPLPYREKASQALERLDTTLRGWSRMTDSETAATAADGSRKLLADIRRVLNRPDVGRLADAVSGAVMAARSAIDSPIRAGFLGCCDGCGSDLFCPSDEGRGRAGTITCDGCHMIYSIELRKQRLRELAENRIANSSEITQAVPCVSDQEITGEQIRKWAHEGRIVRHGYDRFNRPMYRIGEVIEVALSVQKRRKPPSTRVGAKR